jgi:hypothetical protein
MHTFESSTCAPLGVRHVHAFEGRHICTFEGSTHEPLMRAFGGSGTLCTEHLVHFQRAGGIGMNVQGLLILIYSCTSLYIRLLFLLL